MSVLAHRPSTAAAMSNRASKIVRTESVRSHHPLKFSMVPSGLGIVPPSHDCLLYRTAEHHLDLHLHSVYCR
jgi:hypothetical protein